MNYKKEIIIINIVLRLGEDWRSFAMARQKENPKRRARPQTSTTIRKRFLLRTPPNKKG